jgi:predicted XRE-type DNA-binding protein
MNKKYLALLDEGWEHGTSPFDGMALGDAARLQAKAYLRAAILSRIAALAITQREAARRIGVPQPKISNLMSDTAHKSFSSDKLMEFATKLGLDIKIQVAPSRSDVGRVMVAGSTGKTATQKKTGHRKTAKPRKTAKAA